MEVPTINASSNYHLDAAMTILETEPEIEQDLFADQIIEHVNKDAIVRMLLTRDMQLAAIDEATEVTMRKGWAFLKAVFGESVAVPLVCHAGVMAVVGAQRTLYGLSTEKDHVRNRISVPATLVANICDVLAEYNCIDGDRVIAHLLQDVPLTTNDREMVVNAAKQINYTISKPN